MSVTSVMAVSARWPPVRAADVPLSGAILPVMAAGLGVAAWWGPVWAIPLSLCLAVLLARSPSRVSAGCVAGAYALGASWGLPFGAATFFETTLGPGLLLWLCAATLQGLVFGMAWSRVPGRRFAGSLVALALLAVPPLGSVGWASPLTAAGWLFPGLGLLGLGLTGMIFAALAHGAACLSHAVGALGVLFWLGGFAAADAPPPPSGWMAFDTAVPFAPGEDGGLGRLAALHAVDAQATGTKADFILLPESVFGPDGHPDRLYWRALAMRHGVVLVGGGERRTSGHRYNALWMISEDPSEKALLVQRQPVPVSMWRPGHEQSWSARWWGPAVTILGGRKVGSLICYDQLLVWPAVANGVAGADIWLLPSNLWWTGRTRIPRQLEATSAAWARLFGVATLRSVNVPQRA